MRSRIEALRRELLAGENGDGYPLPRFAPGVEGDLFISRAVRQSLHDDRTVEDWITIRRASSRLRTEQTPLQRLRRWRIDPQSGNIIHESGGFFTITGLQVRHRLQGRELEWDQPIIDQAEVGILGILAKRIDGVLHFCLQAKEEPGNIGGVQLSPTVQATYSNYSRAHGGSLPIFVEHFLNPQGDRLLFAKMQTEDGGRFLYKSNRNMVVLLNADTKVELPDDFIWLTLRQIAQLLRRDNLVHACTRSILANLLGSVCGVSGSDRLSDDPRFTDLWGTVPGKCFARPEAPLTQDRRFADVIQWFDDCKAINHFRLHRVGLNTLTEWWMDGEGCFSHRDGRFFRILGIDVSSQTREVPAWSQPILDNPESGIIGLLVRNEGGRLSFLMQAKAEIGNRTMVQLGPTVQFTPGNYTRNEKLPKPFLFAEFSAGGDWPLLWENRQAEEGARFFREDHLHRVLVLPPGKELDLPPDYRWLDVAQLRFFLHLGDYVNSCARSILACLL